MASSMAARGSGRWPAAVPFMVVGAASVVAGGLVAAATASVPSEHGAWVAAYLVLVAGVVQIALGAGQAVLAADPPRRRTVLIEFAAWNVGNAGVIVGTLLGVVPVVDAGGALLVLTLAMLMLAVRRRPGGRWVYGYRSMIAFMLLSVVAGLVLARA